MSKTLQPRHAFDPVSATFALIDSIMQEHREEAKRLLRLPLSLSQTPEAHDKLLIKVAAKRFGVTPITFANPELSSMPSPLGRLDSPKKFESRAEARDWLLNQTTPSSDELPLYARARPIAAVLMDPSGEVLASAQNASNIASVRHAEINLILSYLERFEAPPPVGSVLISTLSPCRMCAGWITKFSNREAPIDVRYLERDPGTLAQGTLLEENSSDRRWLGISEAPIALPF